MSLTVNRKIAAFLCISALAAPLFTLAQIPPHPGTINLNQQTIEDIIANKILPTAWIGAVVFVVITFITIGGYFLLTKGEPEKIEEARGALIWAIAGVAIMVVAWSVVLVVRNLLSV